MWPTLPLLLARKASSKTKGRLKGQAKPFKQPASSSTLTKSQSDQSQGVTQHARSSPSATFIDDGVPERIAYDFEGQNSMPDPRMLYGVSFMLFAFVRNYFSRNWDQWTR